ncbi:Uncharacterised protein [uncultured archaeon]|nr:Uncharacterised protein [uncultured archaeon]
MSKLKTIINELEEHIPFTASASLIAIIIVALIFYFNQNFLLEISKSFETFHGLHIFASAIVSTGIFYKYKKKIFSAILVGILSSIIIGSLSDVILPYAGSLVLGLKPEFHLPIIENFLIIFGAGLIGCIFGLLTGLTKLPHFLHIFLSTVASLFYIIQYSTFTLISFIGIFFVLFIAVIIPCCTSDIVLPILFLRGKHKH